MEARWHCFSAVMKWQTLSNTWKICFPTWLLKTAPVFCFQGQEFTSVCRGACVHCQRGTAGCEQLQNHPPSPTQADFPKEQLCWATPGVFWQQSKLRVMMCLPRHIPKTRIPKLGVVQDSRAGMMWEDWQFLLRHSQLRSFGTGITRAEKRAVMHLAFLLLISKPCPSGRFVLSLSLPWLWSDQDEWFWLGTGVAGAVALRAAGGFQPRGWVQKVHQSLCGSRLNAFSPQVLTLQKV